MKKNHNHNHVDCHDGCCCHHSSEKFSMIKIIFLALALFGLGISSLFPPVLSNSLLLAAWIVAGYEVILEALKNLLKLKWLDENTLMTIATVGAVAIGEYPEAAMVMILYQVGEYLQHKAVEKSKGSIAALMDIRPDNAWLIEGNREIQKSPDQIKVGQIILVKSGEKIPLDGIVVDGQANVDTSALTGESLPRKLKTGDEAVSGCINTDGWLKIKVSRPFGESTVNKIIELVEHAETKKAHTEKFITRFARFYTPIVVVAAILLALLPPFVLAQQDFSIWLKRALTFLVISCPCALVISVPLTFFAGIGGASRRGILIKGGNFLENLAKTKAAVFDKTGTLTKGNFEVSRIIPDGNTTEKDVLFCAALAEKFSNHPIALSIKRAAQNMNFDNINPQIEEIAGMGIKATTDDEILVGNHLLMENFGIKNLLPQLPLTTVYVAKNKIYLGAIEISDQLKDSARLAIEELNQLNITTYMLTGDNGQTAAFVAKELGIKHYEHSLLPTGKVEKIEQIIDKNSDGKTIFVGDGINDAPVLARADVGIAMGGLGSDAAIEAADAVIMDDNPQKVVTAVKSARKTMRIVHQNITFALGIKVLFLALGAMGMITMWGAVFADTGTALLAVVNALRAYRK